MSQEPQKHPLKVLEPIWQCLKHNSSGNHEMGCPKCYAESVKCKYCYDTGSYSFTDSGKESIVEKPCPRCKPEMPPNKDNQPEQKCEACKFEAKIESIKIRPIDHTCQLFAPQPSKKDLGEELENWEEEFRRGLKAGGISDFIVEKVFEPIFEEITTLLHATDQKARRECADIVESYFKGKETFSAHTFKAEEGVIKKILNQK